MSDSESTAPITLTYSGLTSLIAQYDIIDDCHPTEVPSITSASITVAGTTITAPALTPSWGVANTLWMLKTCFNNENPTSVSFPLPDDNGSVENVSATVTIDSELAWCRRSLRASSLTPAAQTWSSAAQSTTFLTAIPAGSTLTINVDQLPLSSIASQSSGTILMNDSAVSTFPSAESIASKEFSFTKRLAFSAGTPGTADDVSIVSPSLIRIVDVKPLVSTAIIGSSLQLRDSSGGGGTTMSSLFSSATTGESIITTSWTSTSTASLGQTFFLRRSDRGVAGEILINYVRM